MPLVRLKVHEHPAPPHHEIRQTTVLDSAESIVGTVGQLYVDDASRQLRYLDVVTSGFIGLDRKHHLLPVEAVSQERPGFIVLNVDQGKVEDAPPFADPEVVPDEEYRRAIREHYGYDR